MDTLISFQQATKIIIKIGSSLLVNSKTGQLNAKWLRTLAEDIDYLKQQGKQVVIVSSGSIALGRRILEFPEGKLSLEQTQASAACGQIKLAGMYEEILKPFGHKTAQILLTLDDNDNRKRFLNARATMSTLLAMGVVPIINENDSIATDEIRFGDNDRLAAQVSVMIGADILVLFSDVDGLYDKDPRKHSDAVRLETVSSVDSKIFAMAGSTGTDLSSGGMKTKLIAARTAIKAGCAMVISEGKVNHPVQHLLKGGNCTWFIPEHDPQIARKHWIASMKPKGSVYIDDGAVQALQSGKSLLPAGVHKVVGTFGRGDAVEIISRKGERLGVGLIRYNKTESELIKGHKSSEIEQILGFPGRAALIHRDDMSW
ncbi:MAG: glutamate 5-kinase [Rhodobacteraceae bacterium]|nr:glutamate 5-kinase [Paracoccaceae bacterium]